LHLGPSEEYIGQGSSIKRAQHAAASEALDKTSLSRPTARTQPKRPYGLAGKRPNWALLQLTSVAEDLKEPISIVQQPITIVDPFRRGDPPSVVSIHVGERIFTGEGSNFNAAKNMAAMIALKAMLKVKQEVELKKLAESGSLNGSGENGVSMENKSPISVVHEMAMKRGMTVKFEVAREEGPPHNKIFTVVCAMGGDECTAEGQGPTKQAAKKTASELMIEKMRDLPPPASSPQIGSLKSIQKGLLRQKSPRKKTSAPVVKDLEKQTVSPISRLIQIAHVRKYKEPEFNLIASSTNGPLTDDISSILRPLSERERRNIRKKKPSFTMEVIVGPHCSRGTGPNKKAAKKAAAEAALVELGYGPTAEETAAKEVAAAGNSNSEKTGTIVKQVKFASVDPSKGAKSTGTTPVDKSSTSSMTCGRQLAPGVLVLSSDSKGNRVKINPPNKLQLSVWVKFLRIQILYYFRYESWR
jgi:double-stranded RNA-binding protein Staufen